MGRREQRQRARTRKRESDPVGYRRKKRAQEQRRRKRRAQEARDRKKVAMLGMTPQELAAPKAIPPRSPELTEYRRFLVDCMSFVDRITYHVWFKAYRTYEPHPIPLLTEDEKREHRRQYKKTYKEKHPEKFAEIRRNSAKKYYARHPEKVRERTRVKDATRRMRRTMLETNLATYNMEKSQ